MPPHKQHKPLAVRVDYKSSVAEMMPTSSFSSSDSTMYNSVVDASDVVKLQGQSEVTPVIKSLECEEHAKDHREYSLENTIIAPENDGDNKYHSVRIPYRSVINYSRSQRGSKRQQLAFHQHWKSKNHESTLAHDGPPTLATTCGSTYGGYTLHSPCCGDQSHGHRTGFHSSSR